MCALSLHKIMFNLLGIVQLILQNNIHRLFFIILLLFLHRRNTYRTDTIYVWLLLKIKIKPLFTVVKLVWLPNMVKNTR